jgi:hypothetical protein
MSGTLGGETKTESNTMKAKKSSCGANAKAKKPRTKSASDGISNQVARGRPTKYDPSMCEHVRKYCLLGATDEQLAELLEVAVSTIYEWKIEYPEFSEAIKSGKEVADAKVAESLFHRATGYSHKAVKIFNDGGKPLVVDYMEHYPPDATSMIFWLSNRRKDQWRQKQEISGPDGAAFMPVINVTTGSGSS